MPAFRGWVLALVAALLVAPEPAALAQPRDDAVQPHPMVWDGQALDPVLLRPVVRRPAALDLALRLADAGHGAGGNRTPSVAAVELVLNGRAARVDDHHLHRPPSSA